MSGVSVRCTGARPQRLTAEFAQGASPLVTMGCGEQCPVVPGLQRDDWPLQDPGGQGADAVRAIRDEVRRRVLALIAEHGWSG